MKEVVFKKIQEVNERIATVDVYGPSIISETLRTVKYIQSVFNEIRDLIKPYKFPTIEEEIYFFRVLKPEILSRLLYYNKIYAIESKYPNGSSEVMKRYLNSELDSLTYYFNRHLDFYQYYRSNSTIHDHQYFVRGKVDIRMCTDSFRLFIDTQFSTVYDYKVAKILAHEMLRIYLNKKLMLVQQKAEMDEESKDSMECTLDWTGKKSALIELGYALYCSGDINQGNADIKKIMDLLQLAFNVDLGDYYRTYIAIKDRKKDRTQYLSSLIERLSKRMDEDDSR